ncbi:MAG: hypothetical protein KDD42_05485 [Bdellovibrionales bacterium]|nr:hypothetical protein [Bdellovibrionales bacterium]
MHHERKINRDTPESTIAFDALGNVADREFTSDLQRASPQIFSDRSAEQYLFASEVFDQFSTFREFHRDHPKLLRDLVKIAQIYKAHVSNFIDALWEEEATPIEGLRKFVELEGEHRTELIELSKTLDAISSSSARKTITNCLRANFAADRGRCINFLARYGNGAVALLERFQSAAYKVLDNPAYAEFLDELSDLCQLEPSRSFESIPVELCVENHLKCSEAFLASAYAIARNAPNRAFLAFKNLRQADLDDHSALLIRASRLLKDDLYVLIDCFKDNLRLLSDSNLLRIKELYDLLPVERSTWKGLGPSRPQLRYLLPPRKGREFLSQIRKIEEIFLEFPAAMAAGLLESFPPDKFSIGKKDLKTLRCLARTLQECGYHESEIGEVFSKLSPQIIRTRPELYPRLAQVTSGCMLSACTYISEKPGVAYQRPEFVIDMARRFRSSTLRALRLVPPDLILSHTEYVQEMLEHTGDGCHLILNAPFDTADHPRLLQHAKQYGKALPSLVCHFQGGYFALEEEHREEIKRILDSVGPEDAENFFLTVPLEKWSDPAILRAASFYEGACGLEYENRGDYFLEGEAAVLVRFREACKERLGITHFYRFAANTTGSRQSYPTLSQTLRHLDSSSTFDRPFIVIVWARADRSGALRHGVREYPDLDYSHTVFHIESGGQFETALRLREIAYLRGSDLDGEPKRKIENVVFANHASEFLIGQGNPTAAESAIQDSFDRSIIGIKDEALLEELGRYFEVAVLDGCNTGRENRNHQNITRLFKRYAPQARLFGFKAPVMGALRLAFDETGRIIAVGRAHLSNDKILSI